jgi:hypothetical protein
MFRAKGFKAISNLRRDPALVCTRKVVQAFVTLPDGLGGRRDFLIGE